MVVVPSFLDSPASPTALISHKHLLSVCPPCIQAFLLGPTLERSFLGGAPDYTGQEEHDASNLEET